MPREPITPGDQIEAHTQRLVSFEILRRLRRLVEETDRQIRLERVATRALLAFFAIVVIAGAGVAMWSSYARGSASQKGALIANPWTAYTDSVRQKVQERIDADYAKDHVPGRGKSLKLRIRLTAGGDLDSVEVERPSGSIAVDEFAMRTVRDVAPFGPAPVQVRNNTDMVTISANFVLH
jgi:TonB family protein